MYKDSNKNVMNPYGMTARFRVLEGFIGLTGLTELTGLSGEIVMK